MALHASLFCANRYKSAKLRFPPNSRMLSLYLVFGLPFLVSCLTLEEIYCSLCSKREKRQFEGCIKGAQEIISQPFLGDEVGPWQVTVNGRIPYNARAKIGHYCHRQRTRLPFLGDEVGPWQVTVNGRIPYNGRAKIGHYCHRQRTRLPFLGDEVGPWQVTIHGRIPYNAKVKIGHNFHRQRTRLIIRWTSRTKSRTDDQTLYSCTLPPPIF